MLRAGSQVPLSDMTALENREHVLKQEVTEFTQVQGFAANAYTSVLWPFYKKRVEVFSLGRRTFDTAPTCEAILHHNSPQKTTPTTRKLTRIVHFRRLARDTWFLNLTLTLSILSPTCTFDFHLLGT